MLSCDDINKIKDELRTYIDENCIFRCDPKVIYHEGFRPGELYPKTPSSQKITWQFYLRRLTHNGRMSYLVALLFFDDLRKKIQEGAEYQSVQIAGLETGSIPMMVALQQMAATHKINLNSFSIRKERKRSGLFNIVDGFPTKDPVVYIDDVINTGSSITPCLDVCSYELGLKPAKNFYTILRFNKDMEYVQYKKDLSKVNYLFDIGEFNLEYDPKKYWIPEDCVRDVNKRPDYF